MAKRQWVSIIGAVVMLTAITGTAIFAQDATETATPVPPPSFTDGRINGGVDLGGLALYCVDKNNNTHITSFQNGAITLWGVADQKYINLSQAQLRGNVEIPQMPSEMEMQAMTEGAPGSATMEATEAVSAEATEADMAASTPMVPGQSPILLARAATPNGEIGFFTMGGDQFALQGYDENDKFFTYTWTGCSQGTLDNTTAPYQPDVTVAATPMMTSTAEATASS